ncbi:ParB/RepB/Spo0J family partition protein [Actinomyces glycerinitolerans]|uniref:Parb/sulfiredoxin n=1 Tax=Actinomyces glycerinitolerans TaxID=1892869 RepID=A0A1M4S3Q1_9ACTO|nr:ParB/RepB/Spo0J family partition protein [Actinomyces glycerinitolerans]SHE26617.1 parb/sulfiredoxin [Actinomyces glycerinitolerans]
MAQKKRGLGRGLQALIPDAQVENPSRRPSDVFFPEGPGADAAAGTEPETARHADDIAATLLAPSKRSRRGGRSAGTRPRTPVDPNAVGDAKKTDVDAAGSPGIAQGPAESAGMTEAAAASTGNVSRETSAAGADAEADIELVPVPGATFAELPVAAIVPNRRQPRQVFDEDDIAELADSIREVGLLQPIVVRRMDAPVDGSAGSENADAPEDAAYELVMGERRLRAAKAAGMETIPAVVRYTADEELLRDALLENLHRVQLNPLEEAAAYQQLLEDFDCTQAELSEKIARSRSQISNTLRLMKLPPLVQRRVAAEVLSAGHARALLGLPDAAAMERVAQRVVAEGLSVRATEEIVAVYGEPAEAHAAAKTVGHSRNTPLPALSTRLSDAFDTRVKVTRGAKKGRITIEFAGDEDLARIVEALAPGTSLDEG